MKKIKVKFKDEYRFAKIDDEDFDLVNQRKWYADKDGYAISTSNSKTIRMHRLILNATDPKIQIDHVDRDKLNNQKSNLRFCNTGQNNANSRRTGGSSKFRGVTKRVGPNGDVVWEASIKYNGITYYLGRYSTQEEAALVYNKKASELWGDFLLSNNVEDNVVPKRLNYKESSKYIGVNKSSGKWVSRISYNGQRIYLGFYDEEVDAAKAYNVAATLLGKKSKLNNVPTAGFILPDDVIRNLPL